MAVEFDPGWEYYEADPEVREVFEEQYSGGRRLGRYERLPYRTIQAASGSGEYRPSLEEDRETFSRLWLAGYTYKEIMAALAIREKATVARWARRLGLPRRKHGRGCSREQQIEYMMSQTKAEGGEA